MKEEKRKAEEERERIEEEKRTIYHQKNHRSAARAGDTQSCQASMVDVDSTIYNETDTHTDPHGCPYTRRDELADRGVP